MQITGRFLLAAGNTTGTIKTYNINEEGGSKDAVAVSHIHTASSADNTAGLTTSGATKTLSGTLYTGRGEYSR